MGEDDSQFDVSLGSPKRNNVSRVQIRLLEFDTSSMSW